MDPAAPYKQRLRIAAWKEFRGFWSDYRLYLGLVGLVSVPSLAAYLQNRGSMFDVGTAAIYSLLSLTAGLIGTYAIAIRKGAEAIDSEVQRELATANNQIAERVARAAALEASLASKHPHDEHKENEVRRALVLLSENDQQLVAWMLDAGEALRSKLNRLGFNPDSLYARRDIPQLILFTSIRLGNGVSEADRNYSINPKFEQALRNVIHPAR